jgi:hypothetical protein
LIMKKRTTNSKPGRKYHATEHGSHLTGTDRLRGQVVKRRSPVEFSCGIDREALLVEESLDERERRG